MHTLGAVRDTRVHSSAIRSQRVVGRGAPRDVTNLAYSVVAIFGPTASGKSSVAQELAARIETEVVSADALQVYAGMPILTNQTATPERLTAFRQLSEEMSVGEYAALAHTASSSYVFRGRFIMQRLLCVELGAPPANAQTEFGNLTLPEHPTGKQTAAAVEAKTACGGCHRVIDPGGLAYEHFDGLGHFRDEYDGGVAIDTSGTISGISAGPIVFDGPAELMEQLATLPETERCFVTQLFRYSASQTDGSEDACSIQLVLDAMDSAGGTLASALIASTQTDQFLYRRGE